MDRDALFSSRLSPARAPAAPVPRPSGDGSVSGGPGLRRSGQGGRRPDPIRPPAAPAFPRLGLRDAAGRFGPRRHGQRGVVLLLALAVALLAGTSVLLARLEGGAAARAREAAVTARALAGARRALIGWSVGAGLSGSGTEHTPGILPFPDRNTDKGGYDGRADCVTRRLSDRHLIGRLASAGETSPCPARALGVEFRDGSGEPLWYAVSRNLVNHRGGSAPDPPINPGLLDAAPAYPWLRLVDENGAVVNGGDGEPLEVAAVIIAPGPPLADQDRTGAAPGPAEYLDRATVDGVTYDNADSDGCRDAVTGVGAYTDCSGLTGEEFILYPDSRDTVTGADSFNDRIAYVTAGELLRAAEARALGEMAVVLERYRSAHGAYPWMAPYTADPAADPTSVVSYHGSADGAGNTRSGMLPIHAVAGQRYDTHYTLSWTIDSGATIATTESITTESTTIGSIPAPSDAELYALASATPQTTTAPAACAWNGDDGVRCAGELYVHGPVITRTWNGPIIEERKVRVAHAEADWRHTGGTGSVGANPSASSPRTRTVVTTTNLPASFTVSVRGRNYEATCADAACSSPVVTGMSVERTLTAGPEAVATFTFTGLEYDLSVAQDGVPQWFVDNEWRRYVYAAVSSEEVGAGGTPGGCIGSGTNCLTVNASGGARTDVPAFLIGAGPALPGQTRAGCGAACLGEYFEPPDNAAGGDSATRAPLAANFNDQVRIVGPQGTSP